MTEPIKLPLLPKGFHPTQDHGECFDSEDMQAYARAAIEAALQAQDREDAERLQYLLRRVCMYQTASYGCKFEILNLPPHFGDCEPDPIPPFLAAIDHARRIEGDWE